MWQPRYGGSLLSAFLVVACLATVGLPQSDSVGGSECEAVRAVVGVSERVILDAATLKKLENDVQSLVDCLPVGGVLELDLAELVLDDSVVLRNPITIEGNGTSVRCPGDQGKEAFQIRSDDVTLSTLAFKGCFFDSIVGLIYVHNSKNVNLEHVEFEGNKNVDGPVGLLATQSEFRLLNVTARNNTGSWAGVIVALDNSEATILDSIFTTNVCTLSGGAIISRDTNVTIMKSTFERNKAGGKGGAIHAKVPRHQ
ncbi:hypothetical protein BSKO_06802 [Bryopsis sp. KO-2023]|nr:hypothetical protein BSKO_06802 [Bryopsis sp. KO-2023]